MTEHTHPGPHLDPELINAFAEGVLPEHERLACLAHVAECSYCREVLFLAQAPPPDPVPASSPAASWWRRWFTPIPILSGAVAACALLVAVAIYRQQTPAVGPENIVASLKTAPRASPPPTVTIPEPATAKPSPRPTARVVAPPPRPAPAKSMPPVEIAETPSAESANGAQFGVVPTPPPAATAGVDTAGNQPLPVPGQSGRDGDAIAQKTTPKPAAAVGSGLVRQGYLAGTAGGSASKLSIEHQQGPISGLSEVKGSVADSSGSAVAGAMVTIRQVAGTSTTTTESNSNGQFEVAGLPPGQYELQISSRGFQNAEAQLELRPQDLVSVASTLTVGSTTETVEVTAESSRVPRVSPPLRGVQHPRPQVISLPSKLEAVSVVAGGAGFLALDSAGTLFFSRNNTKHWKVVKPVWAGKVTRLMVSAPPLIGSPAARSDKFSAALPQMSVPRTLRLMTDTGAVWSSEDGITWSPAPTGH